MKIVSPVYKGKLILCGEIVDFQNKGEAEVSEELFAKIQQSGFPNVFKKGEAPGVKTNERKQFDESLKEVNEEYMIEIDRLKGIIKLKDQTIAELKTEADTWKKTYKEETDKLKKQLITLQQSPAPTVKETAPVVNDVKPSEKKEETKSPEEELREELQAMKLKELQELAIKEGSEKSSVMKMTKEELVNILIGK